MGQIFTFRRLSERRLMSAEADQALTSQECHFRTFCAYDRELRKVMDGTAYVRFRTVGL
jgi:hypothetical protein